MADEPDFAGLEAAIQGRVWTGADSDLRWAKFTIDIDHPKAWNVVQEFGHVPPSYLTGGARAFLSWVIKGTGRHFTPAKAPDGSKGVCRAMWEIAACRWASPRGR